MEDGKIGAPDKVSVASKKPKIKRKRMIDQSEIWEHFDMEMTEYSIRATYPTKTAVTSGLFCHKFDPDGLRKALSFMLIVDQLPYKFVEGEGFRFFCNMMDPRFQVPSWQTVARDCFEMYLVEKKKLKSVLKNCNSRVCLTTDAWTSIQQINYMCLTAHFIDNDWKLQKKILNFCSVTSHKGEEVGKMIEKCLLEWEIDNILAITVDNASSNDTAIAYMKRKINEWKTGVLNCRYLHMRCVAQIINLVVCDGMEFVHESITRVRHAVRFIKQSPTRLLKFKKCVEDEKIASKKLLCLDVPTRWNSTFLMLNAALSLENAFERYAEEDPHYVIELCEREGNGRPTFDDWNNVRRFSEFLGSFYELTLRVSGTSYVTSNIFFHELVNVSALLKELCASDDPEMCSMALKMKDKYDKYWGNPEKMNMLIFIAVVLDPRYKLDYVEWMIKEIYDEYIAVKLVKNLRETLNALYEEYRVLPPNNINKEEISSSKDETQSLSTQKKVEALKSKYMKQKCERKGESKMELEKYLDEETEEDFEEFDILGWWKLNGQRFPTMKRIARDVLAYPISTVASESAFSTDGRVLDPFRSSLSPKVVESLICTQDWLRASPYGINVEECLEEVEQLEQDLLNMKLPEDEPVPAIEIED